MININFPDIINILQESIQVILVFNINIYFKTYYIYFFDYLEIADIYPIRYIIST